MEKQLLKPQWGKTNWGFFQLNEIIPLLQQVDWTINGRETIPLPHQDYVASSEMVFHIKMRLCN